MVPLTWLPVWRSRLRSPLACLFFPQVKAQQGFSLNEIKGRACVKVNQIHSSEAILS